MARAGLFMKRQVKYVTSEGCGLKSQGHFQVANIINSDWIGKVFPVTILLRNVNKLCVCQPIQRYRHVVQFVLKTAEHNIRIETEQATYFGLCQVLTKNAKKPTHNTAV